MGGGTTLQLLLTGFPQVFHHQQHQHCHKQQRGHGVDLGGNALFGHAIDGHGQGRGGGTGGEVGDHEIINGHGEGDQSAGDDTGLDLRQDHQEKGLHPGTAQILGCVHQIFVHLTQLGCHVQDDVGDIEHHMGNEQRAEAQCQPGGQFHQTLYAVKPLGDIAPVLEEGGEEQAQRNTGDNIGVHHGDVVHRQQGIAGASAHAVQADGGKGAGDGGDHGGQQGNQQRGIHAFHDNAVLEQLFVPVQREALPDHAALTGVEGEDDQKKDGGVQEQEHQSHKQASGGVILFHSIIASSSPSPKWFITTMQATTTTIMTMEMAAPRWGL